ncbi:MAG TPA: SprT family zinc-dependent metalloprotease [Smithella sp.]|nr:SprT family zinc-dependent metalloprotease [Smithella sp.]
MNVTYTFHRSKKRRKTISLQIGDNSEIRISAPYYTPIAEINRFVEEKQKWISRTIQKRSQALLLNKEKDYVTGEIFYYLGQPYPLDARFEPMENTGVILWNNSFFLNCPANRDMRKYYFIRWYKKKAKAHLSDRVEHFSQALSLQPRGIRITTANQRWGSCSEDNSLAFSFRLMMAPPCVIDYVVIHELMHIRQKNHSSKFWDLVLGIMPDYKIHRRWLRDNHHKFIL